jgi:transposase-like protein
MASKSCRPGLKRCRTCRKQFTVTVDSIFEQSHVKLNDWVYAFQRICSSKKGISALQLQRELGCQYKTAWFIFHRIRHAMETGTFGPKLGGDVEVDETYVGGKPRHHKQYRKGAEEGTLPVGRGTKKTPVVALVERGGYARLRVVPNVTAKTLRREIEANVRADGTLHTDEFAMYIKVGRDYARHTRVKHSLGQYTSAEGGGTNNAESMFALLKRGMYGNFHHVSSKHLHRYCHEFEFRWNLRHVTDTERIVEALKQTPGKRLMYKGTTANAAVQAD